MRKFKRDDTADFSDNDERWNNQTYKVDVVGIVETVGKPKVYPSRYQGEPDEMKYFMTINRDDVDGQKVMVNCDSEDRQTKQPAIGAKIHFKSTKDGEWLSIAAKAPMEYWGGIYEHEAEKYITDKVLKISSVRDRSVLVEWYQDDGGVMKAFFPKGHVRLKGEVHLDNQIESCDEGKEIEVAEWIWQKKLEDDDWECVI